MSHREVRPLVRVRQARAPRWALFLVAVVLAAGCAHHVAPGRPDPSYHTLPERTALGLPYSDAVRVGDLLFLAGTIGADPASRRLVEGGIVAETQQALENIKANLEAHGSSLDRVVKCTVFLAEIEDFEAMNGVYRRYFPVNRPARTTVSVKALPAGAKIEIDCIAAVRPQGGRS
ncbi:MAG TPA: Rid family detoxifying hydrolase [Thermoanaerobaculia bacterium]|nr:Rid family detoxifying hydrolase [Thermoanaerobaculia bacterium]